MPIPQGRLLTSLLLSSLSAVTWADRVLVNTTTDENAVANSQCSIREAVAYIAKKNTTKAIIDEAVDNINGTSPKRNKEIFILNKRLSAERAKASPDTAVINALTTSIATLEAELTAISSDGLIAHNNKLRLAENQLKLETNKPTAEQNTSLINQLKTDIEKTNADIKFREDKKAAKEKELEDFRNAGINGCKTFASGDTDSIGVPSSATPYQITTKEITINASLSLDLAADTTSTTVSDLSGLEETGVDITPRTVIKAIGNHPLFVIDDGLVTKQDEFITNIPITVIINSIDLAGCNQGNTLGTGRNICAVNGGLISNKESLTINNAILSGGSVSGSGGAIYNDMDGSFSTNQVLLQNNVATINGSAIFSQQSSVALAASLLTKNQGPSTLAIASKDNSTSLIPALQNITFSGNTGTAISARDNLAMNNLTVVLNDAGIDLNGGTPAIYNSIIAGNTQGDCLNFNAIPSDGKAYFSNNIFQIGCLVGTAENHNRQISGTGNETLIADVNGDGKCDAPSLSSVGLLCPLAENGGLTKTHKPRLLVSYLKLDDSPIVNKGFVSSDTGKGIACVSTDQRLLARGICDIGAVEIQGLIATKQGQDITYGQSARLDLLEKIGDGELWPAAQCPDLYGPNTYINGCARITVFPSKGTVSFDGANDQVLYSTTLRDFHGFDKFTYAMTTTISRFSDALLNDNFVQVEVKVVSEPDTAVTSKSLDTGATSLLSLVMLSLLMVWRRIR